MAIDVLAASPLLLLSATTLVGAIWMSILRAIDLLDGFVRDDLVVAVMHRGETPVSSVEGFGLAVRRKKA